MIGFLQDRERPTSPGVVVHRNRCGAFNQNLHWAPAEGRLTCVQNVNEGRGWRLDILDLDRAVADGRDDGPEVRLRRLTFLPRDELGGFWPLDGERALFAVARRQDNVVRGMVRPIEPRVSPPALP